MGIDEELKDQDEQIAAVQAADAKYKTDKNIDEYIEFWEKVWSEGGLKFNGIKWTFMLADLYIKAKRYEDALSFVKKIQAEKPNYSDKANQYIKKIEKKLNK